MTQTKPSTALQHTYLLERLCASFQVDTLYAFGSRARQAWMWLSGEIAQVPSGTHDLDIAVKSAEGVQLTIEAKVRLALSLEDLFGVSQVDLVCVSDADPFLAANIIRGERLYARDPYLADEYDLYILRRAGDLAPFERERVAS